jgi:outer membrane protein assembly factor BamB
LNWIQATLLIGALVAALSAPASSAEKLQQLRPFYPAPAGCAMVHCDARMTDLVRITPPTSPNPVVFAHDTEPTGVANPLGQTAATGPGCAANTRIVVCAYNNNFGDNVVAYDHSGARLWTSGTLLNETAFASVPMIDQSGSVIAADDSSLIRFSPTGQVLWNTPTPGGIPISPVPMSTGAIVLATWKGPISVFDSTNGRLIGSLDVRPTDGDTALFDTVNTPCVVNERLYVSMALRGDPAATAWLAAIDVVPTNAAEPLKVVWHVPFGGPSGASPLCVSNMIYFDGGRLDPGGPAAPHIFAVRDDGAVGTLVWAHPVVSAVPASFALDPRGGFWAEFTGYRRLERRSLRTGAVVETLDVTALVADPSPNFPWSVLSVTGTATEPILVLGTTSAGGSTSYVIAVELAARSLLWKVNISPTFGADVASVQFPIILDSVGKPVMVFAGRNSGAYFLRDPD